MARRRAGAVPCSRAPACGRNPSQGSGCCYARPIFSQRSRFHHAPQPHVPQTGSSPETLSNLPLVHMVCLEKKGSFGVSSILLPLHFPLPPPPLAPANLQPGLPKPRVFSLDTVEARLIRMRSFANV